jgi:peptidyl-prolyl cis-trans isomerase SurA
MSKKFLLLFLSLLSVSFAWAQSGDATLMKVGKTDVKVSEFKYIYEKNNGAGADYSQKSLMEYLDLYTKFKLKVEKAKQLQLDTISALQTELAGYRKQLASSYLIDKEVTEFLLKELYARTQEDVEFSHIFIPVNESATKQQRDEAKAKLREVKAKLVGGTDFAAAAAEYSQDKTTASKGGNMGYFAAKLPTGFYNLETAIYTTPKGLTSDIVESKIGYHIVKVTQKRPARGTVEVSHILVSESNKKLADSLYLALLQGANFEDIAKKLSIDKNTMKNGGKLAPFGINTYDKVFEDAAFSLQKDGDISKPVLTKSGWHIIKRTAKPGADSYELFVRKMKAQINKDQRFDAAKIKLVDDIKKAAGFKEDKNELNRFALGLTEEFYSYKWSPDENVSSKMLFSLGGDKIFTVKTFADFCKKNTKTRLKYDKNKPVAETVEELYIEYVNESAMAYEEQSLEAKYPDFRSLMREYEEGILLFEATKINVWDRANQDTVGLKAFYETVKDKYMWPEKVVTSDIKISTADKKLAEKIFKFSAKNDVAALDKKFNKKSKVVAYTETEYEKGSKEVSDLKWEKNALTPLMADPSGSTYSFKKAKDLVSSRLKTLQEARGYIVADYQDYLEKQWLDSLNKEFNVVIYHEVLNALKK